MEAKNRKEEEPEQSVETETQSLLGSIIVGVRRVAAGMFGSSANFLLSLFGSQTRAVKSLENKKGKRKRLGETSGDGETYDGGNDDQPMEELEQKRWRPDTVYEAVQQFVNNLLGEKDTSDSDSRDENMNTNVAMPPTTLDNKTGTKDPTSTSSRTAWSPAFTTLGWRET